MTTPHGGVSLRSWRLASIGLLLLATVLLIPFLESIHTHSTLDGTDSCALCQIVNHAPVAIGAVDAVTVPVGATPADRPLPTQVAARVDRSVSDSRAPPLSSSRPLV